MIHIATFWEKEKYPIPRISTVSNSSGKWMQLSPFILGPVEAYDGLVSENFENLWQYSKCYREHLLDGELSKEWFVWRDNGWADKKAHRYPVGKGRKPEFSYWKGEKLSYIEARKTIYAPIYARYVVETEAFKLLKHLYEANADITLLDYDAYDHHALGMSLKDVINEPNRIMGHAFVLAMILEGKLEDCLGVKLYG